MELTPSFLALLQQFVPVFTAPTFITFVQVVTGWVFSQRHLFITEIIFSGGNVGNGHWSRFHRFFSHAAWDIDGFALLLAKLVVSLIHRVPHSSVVVSATAEQPALPGHVILQTSLLPPAQILIPLLV